MALRLHFELCFLFIRLIRVNCTYTNPIRLSFLSRINANSFRDDKQFMKKKRKKNIFRFPSLICVCLDVFLFFFSFFLFHCNFICVFLSATVLSCRSDYFPLIYSTRAVISTRYTYIYAHITI